ncbi:MAG: hypothetical protein LBL75_01540 [Rickettsiales bacterium]|nr:hypothetical protein [Rickettsiales bacterium]
MKKILLTSLLAVFAVSAANAAINNSPLYRPGADKFYSVTDLGSQSKFTNNWQLTEKFGYGISDKLEVHGQLMGQESDTFTDYMLATLSVGADYRFLDAQNGWKADLYGDYAVGNIWGKMGGHKIKLLKKDNTAYVWTAGLHAGYEKSNWAVAGHFDFNYMGSESFNWGDEGVHYLAMGVDGFYAIDAHWSLNAGAEYTGYTDNQFHNAGEWDGALGVNYNFTPDMFLGAYITGEASNKNHYNYELDKGFGFGVKFGAEF